MHYKASSFPSQSSLPVTTSDLLSASTMWRSIRLSGLISVVMMDDWHTNFR